MYSLPITHRLAAELLLGGEPQGLVSEQIYTRRWVYARITGIGGNSRVKAAPERAAQNRVEPMRGSPRKSRQITPGQATSGPAT